MTAKAKDMHDDRTVTVRVPISISRRGGRKLILAPTGTALAAAPVHRDIDKAIVKAIARAFRWREMLESGEHSTIRDIAKAERINDSYVSRLLRLTLLAPDVVEAVLDGRATSVTLHHLTKRFAVEWQGQRSALS